MDRQSVEAAIVSYGRRIAECKRNKKVDLQFPDRLYLEGSPEYEHAIRSWEFAKAYYEQLLKEQ